MYVIAAIFLTVVGVALLIACRRSEARVVRHALNSFQSCTDERANLLLNMREALDELEEEIKLEVLLLQAENGFVKPIFINSLNNIRAKLVNAESKTLNELNLINNEINDLKTNVNKGK